MNSEHSFILFYSNYCEHCKNFLVKLKEIDSELFNRFKKICVDNNNKIPKSITSVPTIITPSHDYALTDNAVFMWLDTLAEQYITNSKEPQSTQTIEEGEIVPFVKGEMGSCFSDNFSFLDTHEGPLRHNYSFIDSTDQASSITNNDTNQSVNMQRNLDTKPNPVQSRHFNYTQSSQNFQMPKSSRSDTNTNFDMDLDSFKNNREQDPYIMQAPQRK